MARYHFWGRAVDTFGNIKPSTGITVYLAGTTTAATVYANQSGGTAITTAPQATTDTKGRFDFWLDDSVYVVTQLFDIVVSDLTYTAVDVFGYNAKGDLDDLRDRLRTHEVSAKGIFDDLQGEMRTLKLSGGDNDDDMRGRLRTHEVSAKGLFDSLQGEMRTLQLSANLGLDDLRFDINQFTLSTSANTIDVDRDLRSVSGASIRIDNDLQYQLNNFTLSTSANTIDVDRDLRALQSALDNLSARRIIDNTVIPRAAGAGVVVRTENQIITSAGGVNVMAVSAARQILGVDGNLELIFDQDRERLVLHTTFDDISFIADAAGENFAFNIDGTNELFVNEDGITLKSGASINEFSTDVTLAGNSNIAVPTENVVKTNIDDTRGRLRTHEVSAKGLFDGLQGEMRTLQLSANEGLDDLRYDINQFTLSTSANTIDVDRDLRSVSGASVRNDLSLSAASLEGDRTLQSALDNLSAHRIIDNTSFPRAIGSGVIASGADSVIVSAGGLRAATFTGNHQIIGRNNQAHFKIDQGNAGADFIGGGQNLFSLTTASQRMGIGTTDSLQITPNLTYMYSGGVLKQMWQPRRTTIYHMVVSGGPKIHTFDQDETMAANSQHLAVTQRAAKGYTDLRITSVSAAALEGDRKLPEALYRSDGVSAVRAAQYGVKVEGARLFFENPGAVMNLQHNGSTILLQNYTNGGQVWLQANDNGGNMRLLFLGDPDNFVRLYYNNSAAIDTTERGPGLKIYGALEVSAGHPMWGFDPDETMAANSQNLGVTQRAAKGYADLRIASVSAASLGGDRKIQTVIDGLSSRRIIDDTVIPRAAGAGVVVTDQNTIVASAGGVLAAEFTNTVTNLYDAGTLVFATTANGFTFTDGSHTGALQVAGASVYLDCQTSQHIYLRAQNSGTKNVLYGDAINGTHLYFAGVLAHSTTERGPGLKVVGALEVSAGHPMWGFDPDETMAANSNNLVPTQRAVKGLSISQNALYESPGVSGVRVDNTGLYIKADEFVQGGNLYIGQDNVQRGTIRVYGHATGTTQGGTINLYLSDDHDANVNYYYMQVQSGDMVLADDDNGNYIKFNEGANVDLYYDGVLATSTTERGPGLKVVGALEVSAGHPLWGFSPDETMAANSNNLGVTQRAAKQYADSHSQPTALYTRPFLTPGASAVRAMSNGMRITDGTHTTDLHHVGPNFIIDPDTDSITLSAGNSHIRLKDITGANAPEIDFRLDGKEYFRLEEGGGGTLRLGSLTTGTYFEAAQNNDWLGLYVDGQRLFYALKKGTPAEISRMGSTGSNGIYLQLDNLTNSADNRDGLRLVAGSTDIMHYWRTHALFGDYKTGAGTKLKVDWTNDQVAVSAGGVPVFSGTADSFHLVGVPLLVSGGQPIWGFDPDETMASPSHNAISTQRASKGYTDNILDREIYREALEGSAFDKVTYDTCDNLTAFGSFAGASVVDNGSFKFATSDVWTGTSLQESTWATTITKAMLVADYTGTGTFEMTASGSLWEEVTPNEVFTFRPNWQGADLRVRMTDTSDLVVNSYGVLYDIDDTALSLTTDTQSNTGRKNLIINGDMKVAQRGTSFTGLTNGNDGDYVLDRWYYGENATPGSVVTITQDSDVPTGEGFASSMKIDVTTAEAAVAATELIWVGHHIEAQDLQHLAYGTSSAKDISLSFHLKSDTKVGTICVCFQTPDGTAKYYVTEHTISDNNWNKYTVTIPGSSTSTINNDNGSGLEMYFFFVVGSDFRGTPNTWGGQVFGTSNQANFLDHTDNNIWITGVQLEVGSAETEFEHRSFSQELTLCQKYFQKCYPYATAPGTAEGDTDGRQFERWGNSDSVSKAGTIRFPVTMRAAPAITIYTLDGTAGQCYLSSSGNTAMTSANISAYSWNWNVTVSTDTYCIFYFAADAEL
jgi:hypothetical protein